MKKTIAVLATIVFSLPAIGSDKTVKSIADLKAHKAKIIAYTTQDNPDIPQFALLDAIDYQIAKSNPLNVVNAIHVHPLIAQHELSEEDVVWDDEALATGKMNVRLPSEEELRSIQKALDSQEKVFSYYSLLVGNKGIEKQISRQIESLQGKK